VNEGSEYSGHYYEDEEDDHEEDAAMMSQVDQILKKSLSDRALLSPTSFTSPPPPAKPAPTRKASKAQTKASSKIGEIPSPVSTPTSAQQDGLVTETETEDEDERIGRRNTQGKLAHPARPTRATAISKVRKSGSRTTGLLGARTKPTRTPAGRDHRPQGGAAIPVPKLTKSWPPQPQAGSGGGSPGLEENGLGIEQRLARLRRIEFGEEEEGK
jgi:hypothetical protein